MKPSLDLPSIFGDPQFTLIDVGARGGLDRRWLPFRSHLHAILAEPDEREAQRMKRAVASQGYRSASVIPVGLGAEKGTAKLNLLKNPECSSILEPNRDWLKQFGEVERFDLDKQIDLQISPLDEQMLNLQGPKKVDFIKVDVQGYEREVLRGGTKALADCIGVEAEVSFHSIYRGQPLFADIDQILRSAGFCLFDMERIWWRRAGVHRNITTRYQVIWSNVLYLRDPFVGENILTKESLGKYLLLFSAYELYDCASALAAMAVERGLAPQKQKVELDSWLLERSLFRWPFWRALARLPHFPFKRRISRWLGLASAMLQFQWYGENSGNDQIAWNRKWEWK